MYLLKLDLLSVTFDPKTAEINWIIVTHPIKFSIFRH